jgi:iron complex transport system substrate-binding protein
VRIVSLLPSATEILFAVGAGQQVVGVTHECDFPPEARELPVVTEDLLPTWLPAVEIDRAVAAGVRDRHTIYRLDEELLTALDPDVVVTQALCEVCAVPTRLVEQTVCSMPREARVVSSDPQDLEGIFASILEIGAVVGADDTEAVLASLRDRLAQVRKLVEGLPQPRVAVLEWPDPPYAPGHWVPGMVQAAGGRSVLGSSGRPSRRMAWEEILDSRPDVVVLAFCGFDLAETLRRADEMEGEPWRRLTESVDVMAVDGSAYFSRPGPRVVDGVELLAWLLHGVDDLRPPPRAVGAYAERPSRG